MGFMMGYLRLCMGLCEYYGIGLTLRGHCGNAQRCEVDKI